MTTTDLNSSALSQTTSVGDYWALLKPRVMSLVVFTTLVGMVAAPVSMEPILALSSLLAIAIGAGASGALNMWYEADTDLLMERTAGRPIPAGRIARPEALAFGLMLSAFSVLLLALASNYLAAGLLLFTIFFYAVVYTVWLKRSTAQNIVIGGASGALPPVIAWAAATGEVPFAAWSLFLIIFMWTPPHFWALALWRSDDYARAGIPMMPNVAGERSTRRQIFGYSLVLAVTLAGPIVFGLGSWLYAGVALASGFCMVGLSLQLLVAPDAEMIRRAKTLFAGSIFVLFLVFAALLIEAILGLTPLIS